MCRALHAHCWDYFTNTCTSLSVLTVPSPLEHAPARSHPCLNSSLGVGPGVSILRKSRSIRDLTISSSPKDLAHLVEPSYFSSLLTGLVTGNCNLKKLSFRGVSLEATVHLLERVSLKCRELEELEVCGVTGQVQAILPALVTHCSSDSGGSLHRLSITNLINQPLTHPPLPTWSLHKLKHFSVSRN